MTFLCTPVAMNCAPVCNRVEERGARSGKIKSPDPFCAQLVLHQAGGGGKKHVGSDRGDDDRVQVGRRQAALHQRPPGCLGRKIAGGYSFIHDVAFANAGALHDPVIGGFHQLFQIVVGQKARRNIGAQSSNLGAHQLAHSMSSPVNKRTGYFDAPLRQCPTVSAQWLCRDDAGQIFLSHEAELRHYPRTCT